MLNLIEILRQIAVTSLFNARTFSTAWNSDWKTLIQAKVGSAPTADSILNLGEELSTIFRSTGSSVARNTTNSQAGVSQAGTAWECLMCWYLNVCTIGTRVVAFKSRSLLPSPFRDALTISYGTTKTHSESDLTVLVFPDDADFTNPIGLSTKFTIDGKIFTLFRNNLPNKKRCLILFNALSKTHFTKFSLSVVQCKTNWNDNAQIPMLWDLVYNARTFAPGSHVTVGDNNWYLRNLNGFSYCFVTVPTNKLDHFDPTKMTIKRVANLSGKNYWGRQSLNGVAFSVKEIFYKNFSTGFSDLRATLASNIPLLKTNYNYFDLY